MKEKEIIDQFNELFAWLDSECPAVAPPLEPYDNSDLSHNFCELLRIRLDEIARLKAEQGEQTIDSDVKVYNERQDLEAKFRTPVEQSKLSAEECPNCKETINPCACMRNMCLKCGKPVGNITFTVCDDCWDKDKIPKIVPIEIIQEKIYKIMCEYMSKRKVNSLINMIVDIANQFKTK